MLTTTDELRENRGRRVRVTFHDDSSHEAVLEGATAEKIFFAGESQGVDRDQIAAIQPVTLTCSRCHRNVTRLFDGLCADDFREDARRKPVPREPCAVCGAAGIREPGTNEFLCAQHHAEAGNKLRMNHSASNVLAECYTDDVNSSRHEWGQVRGARFRCVRCQTAEKWDPELLKELRGR